MKRIVVLILILFSGGCSSSGHDTHETRFMMGTLVDFTISGVDKSDAEKAITAAANEMQRVDDLMTIYREVHNPVKDLNSAEVGRPFPLPEELSRLIRTALQVQQESGNAFDPSLGELDLLWGFSMPKPRTTPPPADDVHNAIPPANCFVEVSAGWIRQNKRCELDLGGIAKGYAIDRGVAVLKSHGIHDAIIDAGGDIRLIGNHHGKPWKIGVRDPRNPDGVIASLGLQGDKSIVSSGDYERFFMYNGKRYHHILNPTTGWPADSSQSATVIASTATLADAWSTALFVRGKAGLPTLEKRGMEALLVNGAGHILMTPGMRKMARLSSPPLLRQQ